MNYSKIKKYMIVGLIGAFITVIGEMLGGWGESTDFTNQMTILFSSFDNMSIWQIGLGSSVGVIGILIQFFGVYGIYLSFADKKTKCSKIYRVGMYIFSVVGSLIHVLMSMMVYVYKINYDMMIEFTIWFVLPIMVIFFAGYIPFAVVMAIQFFKKQTPYSKWIFLLNPLFGKAFFNILTSLLPSCAFVNAISYSNMGLSSIILFTVILISTIKLEKIQSNPTMMDN